MGWHREAEFQCQIGLGVNLCIVPPQDHGVLIAEGKGMGVQRYRDMKMVPELTQS